LGFLGSEWIQKPANSWELTSSNALSGNFSLKHKYKSSGRDTIFLPVTGITFAEHDVTWKFLLHHTYNPAAGNKWLVILATNTILSNLNGYAVGVNMRNSSINDDILCLYRITNGAYTEIIRTNINWEVFVTKDSIAALDIRRNANDYWQIGIDVGKDFSNISFYNDSVLDVTHSNISYFGILHVFTTTASESLYIDNISIDAVDKTIARAFDTEIIPPTEQIAGQDISSVNEDTIEVFKFGVHDIAGSDVLPTYLHQITVKNVKPLSSANWKTTVKNAYLHAESIGYLPTTTLITNDSIVFLLDNDLHVSSGGTINLSMKIDLNDSLTDNAVLQFKIDKKHGFISSTNGSGIVAELTDNIVSNTFIVDVEADTITWKNVPNSISVNSEFSIIAAATDNKGNIDKNFSHSADLVLHSGSGTLSFNPPTFVNGELTIENVSYNKMENIVIRLTSQSLTSANHDISIDFNQNSIIKDPSEKISGTTIMAEAVSIENEISVFRFVIKDDLGDNAATTINELKFTNPLNATNWSNVIGGISLYNGTQRLITNITEQAKGFIRVGLFPGSLTINDGAEKEIELKIWLKTKVPDKTKLVFMIPATNHGCQAMQSGSLLADNFIQDIVSDTFSVEVRATKIIFKNIPATVTPDSPFSLEINAVNSDGTIDIDATEEITLELVADSGNLNSISGTSKQLIEGKVDWNDLTVNVPMIFKIKAIHPDFGEITSDEIVSMDMNSEVLPVLFQQQSVFKSTDTLMSNAKEIIRFQISDKGANDSLPTVINKMIFSTISEVSIPDLIGGIELLSDNQNVLVSFTSSDNQIIVIPTNLTIPNGESREIILKIFLKRVKGVDGSKLQFYIPPTNHGWTVNHNSSQLLKTFEYPIYSEVHYISIEASRLMILNQPMIVQKNAPFSLNIGATDHIGNVDTSFGNNISILKVNGTGNLQNLSATQFAGTSTFICTYNSFGNFSFKSASAGIADVFSMPIYSANYVDTAVKFDISTWNNTGDWVWSVNKLKHNSGNGLSYISVPVDIDVAKEIVKWDFTIENGNFDPSADNAFWCVLASDKDNLDDENLSGYVVGVNYTGSSDLVSFWKVKTGSKQLLWSSNYDWNANTTMRIIVQKSENDWQIFIKEKEQPIMLAGQVSENELFDNKFSGFVFKYTSTRNGMFSINNYEVIKANQLLKVSEAEIIDKNNIKISFSTNLTFPNALNLDNYLLKSSSNTFGIFSADKIADNEVKLSTQLLNDTLFLLSVSGLTDIYGSTIKDTIIKLRRNVSPPAKISKVEAVSSSTVIVEFSKNIQDAGEYVIKNSHGTIFDIASKALNNKQVTLTLSKTLSGNSFMLYIYGAKDNEEFTINDSAYFRYQTINFGDLVVNEIMAKPNPPVSLPNREYLELYNRTADTIYLTDFRILYGTGRSSRITTSKIAPYGYVVICASASVSELSTYGDVFSATSFPSLLDAGMVLTLISPDSTVVAVVEYDNSSYSDENKSKGGWSLERIDPNNFSDNDNWKASIDVGGGTPCKENSVARINPDTIAPYVEKTEFSSNSGLIVYFSERIYRNFLSISTNYLISDLSLSSIDLDDAEYLNSVELICLEEFKLDKIYELRVSGISDIAGNTISDTIIYVLLETPKVTNSKVANLTELQITFSESMVVSDAQNIVNYKLLSSLNTQLNIFGLTLDPTKRKNLSIKTEALRDSLIRLEIKNLKDDRGYSLKDTIIEFYRAKPQTNFKLESVNRTLLSLTFNINMVDSTILNKANYKLINTEGGVFAINNIVKSTSKKINLDCDSLQGNAFVLYYNNLETEDGFIFNDSIISEKSYLPAKVNTVEAVSSSTVIVEFSKNIQDAGEYVIKNSHGTVFDIASKTFNNKRVTLTLFETLSGNNFMLYIYGVKDNEGFTIIDSAYFRYQTVNFGDLVFNEIMAKPNPPVSLPNREYLELYNRTADTIYLTDFRILYGTGKSSRITTGKIAPYGYTVICASASVSELSTYGNVFAATSFPSLLDAGMVLTLTSPDSTVIAVVEYNNSFYGDENKSKGGWSLERIDPDNLSDNGNWHASTDTEGGTPCKENSILEINPDITAPYVEKTEFLGISGLIVYFSERITRNILSINTNYSISSLSISSINLDEDEYLNTVELVYSEVFELDKVYELHISGISDIAGNTISDTIIYVFIEAPKVTSSKVANLTELQISFSESMIASDAQNIANYRLLSSSNTQLNILDIILEPTKRKDLSIKTETLKDSLLRLEIKNLRDGRGYLLKDTVIEFYRTKSQIDFKLESASRTLLSLTFNINMVDSTILSPDNYKVINTEGTVFAINDIIKSTAKRIYLNCDSLQGNSFVLYYNNLETEDGFILNDSVILEQSYLPAKVNKVEAISLSIVIVEFSKNIQGAGEYVITNSHGTVFGIASKTIDEKQVTLTLSEMLSGNSFMLHISDTKDNEGFIVNDSAYFRYQVVNFGDLVFNEIMAKPNPPVSLPDREYLELYNRTIDTIDITDFRILYGADKSSRITTGKIAPYGYALICASSSVSELSTYGDVFSATSFPSLLDAGMMLTLTSPDNTVIAVVEYDNSFYGDETKSKGGWSLERIDSDNLSDNGNWKASTNIEGGTPCRENSIFGTNPDNIQPYVIKTEMINEYSIRILFSENIVSSMLERIEYYIVRNVGTPSEAKVLNTELSNTVELIFANSFNIGTVYELAISPDIKDFYGNEYRGDLIYFGQMYKPEKENLVINEILFHPRSGGSDFVEVYNRSDRILDLSDIFIASRNRATGDLQQIHKVSEISIYIQPADYFVFTTDSASLHQFYYVDNPANVAIMSGFPTYPNENGTVVLLDNENNIIDEFSYSEDMHGIFISNPEGVSLERVDFERKSSELGNWQSAAQTVGFATPTYKNSCYTHTEEVNESFVLTSTTFSPDGDGYEDVLFIDYKMPAAGFIANIRIYNLRGSFVKEICRNTALGTDGRLTWDGTKANNTKAPIGPYIIYIEVFNADGKVYKYKKICVVASQK
jgi:hypothetical protein